MQITTEASILKKKGLYLDTDWGPTQANKWLHQKYQGHRRKNAPTFNNQVKTEGRGIKLGEGAEDQQEGNC